MSNRVIRMVIIILIAVVVVISAKCVVDMLTTQFTDQINALFSVDALF